MTATSTAGSSARPRRRLARRQDQSVVPPARSPLLSLAAAPPAAVLLAVATSPGDAGPVLVHGEPPLPDGAVDLANVLVAQQAKGAVAEIVAVPCAGDLPHTLLLVGLGEGDPASLRRSGAALARRSRAVASLSIDLRAYPLSGDGLQALVEGLLLASYSFPKERAGTPGVAGPARITDGSGAAERGLPVLREITLVVAHPETLQARLEIALATVRANLVARDLVNTPPLVKSPAWLADQAGALLSDLKVTVRDERALRDEGFGGLVGVGMGSSRPPRLIEATWDGAPAGAPRRHVVLIGKGITFDTGGLSLKTNDGMQTMKDDMGGGAAVLGALRAVADLALPITVTALVAAAENMPDGAAQRPGDVITQYGGRTVEVLNTDAEGRLVLADALAYADLVLEADIVVDVATLTGAMPIALGKRIAGMFATDDALAAGLQQAGEAAGEHLWRLPLVQDYRAALDSPIADLRNIGDARRKLQGGSIIAALFLREFAGGRPWAHLDIAGPAWSGGPDDELTKGGTGFGVRLLVRWLQDLAATPAPRRPTRRRT